MSQIIKEFNRLFYKIEISEILSLDDYIFIVKSQFALSQVNMIENNAIYKNEETIDTNET